jgi:hypothetical protein
VPTASTRRCHLRAGRDLAAGYPARVGRHSQPVRAQWRRAAMGARRICRSE